jgi:hypothetical protein
MKEDARIKQKRENNEIRRVRYLKARQRLIGIDLQALNAQIEEKRKNLETLNEADRLECKLQHHDSLPFSNTSK